MQTPTLRCFDRWAKCSVIHRRRNVWWPVWATRKTLNKWHGNGTAWWIQHRPFFYILALVPIINQTLIGTNVRRYKLNRKHFPLIFYLPWNLLISNLLGWMCFCTVNNSQVMFCITLYCMCEAWIPAAEIPSRHWGAVERHSGSEPCLKKTGEGGCESKLWVRARHRRNQNSVLIP